MIFIYLQALFITWKVYLDPTQRLAPSWLVSSVVECCTGIAKVMGSSPVQAWIFFSGLISSTSSVMFITARSASIYSKLLNLANSSVKYLNSPLSWSIITFVLTERYAVIRKWSPWLCGCVRHFISFSSCCSKENFYQFVKLQSGRSFLTFFNRKIRFIYM